MMECTKEEYELRLREKKERRRRLLEMKTTEGVKEATRQKEYTGHESDEEDTLVEDWPSLAITVAFPRHRLKTILVDKEEKSNEEKWPPVCVTVGTRDDHYDPGNAIF